MLSDPSASLGRYCHEHQVVSYMAPDANSLKKALIAVKTCRQVFIETPDLMPSKGSQDPALSLLIQQRVSVAALLVLPCNAQTEYLARLAEHAEQLPVAGALITARGGDVTGIHSGGLVGHELPVAGISDVSNAEIVRITAEGLINESKRLARRN